MDATFVETEAGATEVLAAFAAASRGTEADHSAQVARAVLDTVAVAIGSTGSDGEPILREWAARESAAGPATVWTSGGTATASIAALVNGTAAHVLDFDDISPSMPMHPSAVLVPALVSVAEARVLGSTRFVEAYDVGAAAFRALADLLPQHVHYARGWHTTSTVGRLAAVAALVRLVGADLQVARHAIGIVASLAAGSRPNFGSMTKPFHAGLAARDAVMALELAEAGFTANPAELEAAGGFLERYGDPELAPVGPAEHTLDERLDHWMDAWVGDWGIKRYPSCYATHRGIDAVRTLRESARGRTPLRISATLHPRGTRALRPAAPTSGTQAKFSLEYTLAVAWRRGDVTLSDFTDEVFADAEVRALMRSISIGEATVPPVGPEGFRTGYTVVEVEFDDGTREAARIDVTRGQAADPLSDAELKRKFDDCATVGGYDPAEADELHTALAGAPGTSFTTVIRRKERA